MSTLAINSVQPRTFQRPGITASLRIWFQFNFVTAEGLVILGGPTRSSSMYINILCTLDPTTHILTIPSFSLPTTNDSSIRNVRASGLLFDSSGAFTNDYLFKNWIIPEQLAPSCTFAELDTYNSATNTPPGPTYPTTDQVEVLINNAIGTLNDASSVVKGRTYLDVDPAVSSIPVAVGINSPLLYSNSHLLPASNVLTPQLYGAFADGAAHLISAQDITDNPQWIGTYTTAYSWDTVATQEAIYACFATNSTPGNVVWNAEAGTTYLDRPLCFLQGLYYINKQLEMVATGFDVWGSGKLATFIYWHGADDEAMWYCDAVAYGTFAKMSLVSAVETSEAMLELDWTGVHTGILKTNNISLYDMQISGGSLADIGVRISKSGSSSQGDTINLQNTSFSSTLKAGLALGFNNAQNVLGINMYGGGFIACKKDGISVTGGQIYVRGTFFGNQFPEESATLKTQIAMGGADVHVYSGAGASGLSSMRDIRSESDVLSIGVAHLDHCAQVDGSIELWIADSSYQIGQLIKGTPGVGQPGEAGRTFLMVDSTVGTGYITPDPSGTTSVIVDNAASYTINEWVGYGLTIRYPNGFISTRLIASNTATTITLVAPLAFDYHTCSGQVCTAACGQPDQAYPCSQYRIAGVAGSSEPDWDSVPEGYCGGPTGSGLGANITQGDTTLTSVTMGNSGLGRDVGDYVLVTGAGADGGPLISRIASINSATSVELDDAASETVVEVQWYVGTPLTDGSLQWIDLDYNAVGNPSTMKAVYLAAGRVRGAPGATIYGCKFSRPDWMRKLEFGGGTFGDNNFPSFIFNNTVGAGDINETIVPYNLFNGTASGYQQIAPFNMAAGMMSFDSYEANNPLGPVAFGRGDGRSGLTPGTAEYITRNVAGVTGTLGPVTPIGTDQAGPDFYIQAAPGTGSGAGGTGHLRASPVGSSGSTPNNSADVMTWNSTGVTVPKLLREAEGAVLSISSNIITPTNSIHHVTAGLIKTITVPSGFTSGTIYLVPDDAFTYDATGNIIGTGTAVVGRVMSATYSSSTGKWYMGY